MKRLLSLLVLFAINVYSGMAQEQPLGLFGPFHFELGVGTGLALNKIGYDSNQFLKSASAELKYTNKRLPMDYGIGAQIMKVNRSYGTLSSASYASLQLFLDGIYKWIINDDLVFCAGIATGASHSITLINEPYPEGAYRPQNWSMYFAPQIGLEAWKHYCLKLSMNLMDKAHSFVGITISFKI